MIQIYTGNGKGKTTAALGLSFRAMGQGKKVVFVQFLKAGGCGEHIFAKQCGLEIHCSDISTAPWIKDAANDWKIDSQKRWLIAKEKVTQCDILVCDELLGTLKKGFVTIQDIIGLINDAKNANIELVITGRDAPNELIDLADLVTEMKCIKHYVDTGCYAREGIEY